jgi:hypothetical protein
MMQRWQLLAQWAEEHYWKMLRWQWAREIRT